MSFEKKYSLSQLLVEKKETPFDIANGSGKGTKIFEYVIAEVIGGWSHTVTPDKLSVTFTATGENTGKGLTGSDTIVVPEAVKAYGATGLEAMILDMKNALSGIEFAAGPAYFPSSPSAHTDVFTKDSSGKVTGEYHAKWRESGGGRFIGLGADTKNWTQSMHQFLNTEVQEEFGKGIRGFNTPEFLKKRQALASEPDPKKRDLTSIAAWLNQPAQQSALINYFNQRFRNPSYIVNGQTTGPGSSSGSIKQINTDIEGLLSTLEFRAEKGTGTYVYACPKTSQGTSGSCFKLEIRTDTRAPQLSGMKDSMYEVDDVNRSRDSVSRLFEWAIK